jgi:hypothetical protein
MHRSFLLILTLALSVNLLTSCINEPGLPSKQKYDIPAFSLSHGGTIALPLDSITPPLMSYFQILNEDNLLYCFYNPYNQSIYQYDFRKEKLYKIISIQNPLGEVPDISTFYVINSDSILLFPKYGSNFFLCDSTGVIYNKKSFVDADDKDKIESHWVSSSAPLIKIGSDIYINNVFGWIATPEEKDKFLLIKYNLTHDSSTFLIKHPSEFHKMNFANTTFRHMNFVKKTGADESIIYSFNSEPFIYDLNTQKKYYSAPDEFKVPLKLPKNIPGEKAWLAFQSNYSFSKMVYDSSRNLLIRTFLNPHNVDDMKSGVVNSEDPKKPGLLIFDAKNNYSLLGYYELDKSKDYYFINSFSTREGLWVQEISNNENIMKFQLFKFN